MNDFINFFIEPYKGSDFINIVLEIIAVLLGIISVILAQKVHIGVYPAGIISSSIYIYITFIYSLYGEFIINIYYTLMNLYGWYKWSTKNRLNKNICITFSNRKDLCQTALLWIITFLFTAGIYYFIGKMNYNYVWMDIFITPMFFAGMYQLSLKKVENWLFWIIGDSISVPLYFIKGLPITGIQFAIFTCLAFRGYFLWKRIT